ncbi:MAG TPA: DUF2683 family protein [Mucilaginibacter sp.]
MIFWKFEFGNFNCLSLKAQQKTVTAFLEALNVQFEKKEAPLPPHVLAGIKRGQEDIKNGDTVTYEEFKQQLSISK